MDDDEKYAEYTEYEEDHYDPGPWICKDCGYVDQYCEMCGYHGHDCPEKDRSIYG